jgi:hypothetical protein
LISIRDRWRSTYHDATSDVAGRRDKVHSIDGPSQALDAAGESLFQRDLTCKRDDRGFILAGPQHRFQE